MHVKTKWPQIQNDNIYKRTGGSKQWWIHLYEVIPQWVKRLLSLSFIIYYCAHVFGCLWWFTTVHNAENSWWVEENLKGKTTATQVSDIYIYIYIPIVVVASLASLRITTTNLRIRLNNS